MWFFFFAHYKHEIQVASFHFLRFFAAQYQQLQLVIVCSTETSLFFGLDFKKAVIFLAFFTVEFGTSFPIWFDPKNACPITIVNCHVLGAVHSFILCKWAKWAAQTYIYTTFFKLKQPKSSLNINPILKVIIMQYFLIREKISRNVKNVGMYVEKIPDWQFNLVR